MMMDYKPFEYSWREVIVKSGAEKSELGMGHLRDNYPWALRELDGLNADYVVVGGRTGEVYRSGSIGDYPNDCELANLAYETNEVPFVFQIDTSPEELAA